MDIPHPAGLSSRVQALRASPTFSALPQAELKTLAAAMAERSIECGAMIFLQSDEGSALFAVLTGQVRIVVGGADGREHVLRRVGPGEIFGEISVLDNQPRTADAFAATRCRLLVLERRTLLALMRQHPAIAINIISVLCEKLRATSAQVESLLFHGLPKRLAAVLLDLAASRRGNVIDITQSELGRLTGVTREWVNKKLRSWQTAGLISLQPGRIVILQPAMLKKSVCSMQANAAAGGTDPVSPSYPGFPKEKLFHSAGETGASSYPTAFLRQPARKTLTVPQAQ